MTRIIFLSIVAASFLIRSFYSLHMLQLEEYSEKKFIRWIFSHLDRYFSNFVFLISIILYFFNPLYAIPFGLFSLYLDIRKFVLRKKKKPLVFTKRLRRLLTVSFTIFLIFFVEVIIYNTILLDICTFSLVLFNSIYFWLINGLMIPIERLINNYYFKDAVRKYRRLKPLTIAVTGSYGKTSTKYFIHHIVSEYYKTLMTPESYNTTMGITKTIREKLDKSHEIFVVELAENDSYGYNKLLKLVQPEISVLTSIGVQHFEEFDSMEKIFETFKEYLENEKSGKMLIVNLDDENVKKVISKISNKKIITCGIENNEADYVVKDLKQEKNGSKFRLLTPNDVSFEIETNVFGIENIRNLLLAIVTAFEIKVPVEEVLERVKDIQRPKHRLEIIRDDTITVIDDTFNSNPKGFKMALEYLKLYNGRRKIVVTPGFVELGEIEDEEHYKLGKSLSKYADYVFLVGKDRTKEIKKGLLDSNFPEERIFVVDTLEEVTEIFKKFLKQGDVVLFENDLPDNYM
ncbi:Mur ligase family protein [Thermosipho atlanticus]|uniref:UDP-N-acetylmuramoyl-tripeptide--D-alanyl-D-alanine ligase n=1 Tax=Thermosipho atlanticus DSM 15807 TaxID=1123380 RepID=A0A1M5T8Q3_9BACT|nr:UDP-N-acetylmuramoyl-tripeptide--D-alanyl-D-alanine ligase [Thermosipho atlanticus]SHH47101.1 UDP-N-acetylmuramoyl-tripeptide--D-alanyl-D-alanine ligase [Thermosipho atlanticus DSM 15807]